MRFHQLQHGARFEFRGTVFRKISPLKAESEADGVRKLIPRSTEITLVDEHGRSITGRLPETLASKQVETELARFFAACDHAAQRLEPALTETQGAQLQSAIGAAARDLLKSLTPSRQAVQTSTLSGDTPTPNKET